jgi:hypothetical protein
VVVIIVSLDDSEKPVVTLPQLCFGLTTSINEVLPGTTLPNLD